MPGAIVGPAPTFGALDGGAGAAGKAGCGVPAVAASFACGLVRFAETVMAGSVRVFGGAAAAPDGTGIGAAGASGGGDWADPCGGNPGINANVNAIRRNARDTSPPKAERT